MWLGSQQQLNVLFNVAAALFCLQQFVSLDFFTVFTPLVVGLICRIHTYMPTKPLSVGFALLFF